MCSRLKGQNIVPFIGVCSTPKHPSALVFDFMDNMNLREYLRNNRDVGRLELVGFLCTAPLVMLKSRGQLLEIARGVEYMHKLDVIHGNLKSVRSLHYHA